MSQLIYPVAEILGRPGEYRDFSVQGSLAGEGTALAHLVDSRVTADLRAESVVEGVLVTGHVGGEAILECARCLTDFTAGVPLDVCELYVRPGPDVPKDDDAYEVRGLEIDLEPMLRDAVVLALPLNPLCREDCAGLCARCGQDLNLKSCDCTEDNSDPRWAALESVREQLEKAEG